MGNYFKGTLKKQGALPITRYQYLRDINRLEYMIDKKIIDIGFAIILSNDEGIWAKPSRKDVKDITARFYDIDNTLKTIPNKVCINANWKKPKNIFKLRGNYQVPMFNLNLPKLDIQYYYSINEIIK